MGGYHANGSYRTRYSTPEFFGVLNDLALEYLSERKRGKGTSLANMSERQAKIVDEVAFMMKRPVSGMTSTLLRGKKYETPLTRASKFPWILPFSRETLDLLDYDELVHVGLTNIQIKFPKIDPPKNHPYAFSIYNAFYAIRELAKQEDKQGVTWYPNDGVSSRLNKRVPIGRDDNFELVQYGGQTPIHLHTPEQIYRVQQRASRLQDILDKSMGRLIPLTQRVIEEYYGLGDRVERSSEDIAKEMGVKTVSVRTRVNKAIEMMKSRMTPKQWEELSELL